MSILRLILISTLLIGAYYISTAQEIHSVRITKYTQKEGLSSNYVSKINIDQYGYIWVGTQEGLNVFDGKSFKVFSNQSVSNRNLEGSYILDLKEDKKRSLLWVLTSFAPISGINLNNRTITNKITHDDQKQPFTETWAKCILQEGDQLWIGGLNTLSAWHIPSNNFLDLTHLRNIINASGQFSISKIIQDQFGNIWILIDNQGIMVLNRNREVIKTFSLKELANEQNKENLFFWDVTCSKDQVIMGTNWGLLYFYTSNIPQSINLTNEPRTEITKQSINSLAVISDSLLMFSSTNSTYLKHILSDKVTSLSDETLGEQIFSNVYHIYGNASSDMIWLGSQSGLISFTNRPGSFRAISKSIDHKFTLNHLFPLFTLDGRNVYVGETNGIYKVDTQTKQINLLDSVKNSLLIFQGPEKKLYVSGEKKFLAFDNEKKEPESKLVRIPKGIRGYQLNSIINYNDSLTLLGSYVKNGLVIWNTNNNQISTFPPDSISSIHPGLLHVNNLFKSPITQEVISINGNAIVQFNPLNYSYQIHALEDPDSGKNMNNFMDMNESPDSYFIGTYGDGLIETDKQFNVKRIYTIKDGLSNNCIYRIFNIKDEKMLMTTNNGLSILDLKTKKFKTYYEGDGLHGNGFEQFCGYQKDNKIYVGGPGGFTIVNTDLLPDSSVAPILYPTGITINTPDGKIDSTHLEMSSFTIPNDAFKTTLKFVSPDYKNPDRMKYRYKIDELSEEWVELGNQNFVDLIGVNPGKYHFEVIATNSEGTDSKPLKMTLDFLPKWYQTTWFKILLLLLVAGLVYWVQRYRMIQIKKQQTIRKEIANDLHDDIGSTLNSLKIFAHLAQSDTNNKSHIEQIEESISEATVGLRDMIWVLEDEQDSAYEIMERVKKFASPICMAHDIEFVGTVNATSEKPIPKKIKRNIFLVAKECINNSVKYAECSRIEVVLTYSKSKLQLTIEDNGKGFDYNEITKGKGLDSMEYRANQVQFDCDIQSRIGSGTTITMQGTIG